MSVVGIDLGTTNTVVASVRAGKVHVLADEHGQRLLPSVVSFHPNGEVLVGGAARARRVIDPRNTVYSHKRLIGRSWGSPEIVQAKQRFAFELREGPGQGPLVHARGQDYTLPEISAFVLKRTKQIAETALGTPVERAVITVPAHFNELQRASTKVAGRVSGLEVLRILNEPTAAALAYGLGRAGNERVAVYDFGGGTFDCTLLDLSGNVFEVLATAGDSFLGGDDVDALVTERMAEAFLKTHRIDPRTDPSMLERLRAAAEEMKVQLSLAETHTLTLKDVAHGLGGSPIHFTFSMTRRDLEQAVAPLIERTFKVTEDALSLARLTPTGFDKVILVGGSTRMPLVRRRVEAFFGTPPLDRVNPDEVVAIGAAIQAAALTEGQKRRSIPAPPPVPGQARTLPGISRGDEVPTTQVAVPKPGGLTVGSPPSSRGRGGPPSTKAGPPPSATPRVRPPSPSTDLTRKATAPGVAPPSMRDGEDDDPSFPSFAGFDVPTPFEWSPSSAPRTDERPAPSFGNETERSFGDFSDATTDEGLVAQEPEPFQGEFGDLSIDTIGASARPSSGPTVPGSGGLKRPPTSDEFGRIKDISIVSTSTETKDNPALADARERALAGPFGADDDDDTAAMSRGSAELRPLRGPAAVTPHDEAADLPAVVSSTELPSVARGRPSPSRKPGQIGMSPGGGSAMLGKPPPAVAPQPFGRMERVEEEPPSRTAAMPPKAPPPAAPKGFVPTQPSPARAPVKPANAPVTTSPMPARPAAPNTTSPMPARAPSAAPPFAATLASAAPPGPPPTFAPAPQAPAPFAPAPAPQAPPPFAPAPPGPPPFASAPPAAYPETAPMHATPMAPHPPPPHAPPFGSAPPPYAGDSGPYASFGSAPPPPAPSPYGSAPPPIFGQYPSSPPGPSSEIPLAGPTPYQQQHAVPQAPAAPRNLAFAAPVLVDVTPRALVVETAGGYTDTIIPRNAKIPCERTRRFATGRDMQTTVRVRVAQGEHAHFPHNTYLGEVELSGLRAARRGEVVVAVTFEVDADGTLRVRARDVQTGQEARATLQLVGVADESSVVMMINRFAHQPVTGNGPAGPG